MIILTLVSGRCVSFHSFQLQHYFTLDSSRFDLSEKMSVDFVLRIKTWCRKVDIHFEWSINSWQDIWTKSSYALVHYIPCIQNEFQWTNLPYDDCFWGVGWIAQVWVLTLGEAVNHFWWFTWDDTNCYTSRFTTLVPRLFICRRNKWSTGSMEQSLDF